MIFNARVRWWVGFCVDVCGFLQHSRAELTRKCGRGIVIFGLLLARHHREEELLDAAILSVVGRILSSSNISRLLGYRWENDVVLRHKRVK